MRQDINHVGLTVGGAVEIFRFPGYWGQSGENAVNIVRSNEFWALPSQLDVQKKDWISRHPNERSDQKVAIQRVEVISQKEVNITLRDTAWAEVRPIHSNNSPISENFIRPQPHIMEWIFPNLAVVHVLVATSDGWLMVLKRSEKLRYHPGAWSASLEEGVEPKDLDVQAVFEHAARRGLAEELSVEFGEIDLSHFKLSGLINEYALANPAVVVVATLSLTKKQIPELLGDGEISSNSFVYVPIEPEVLTSLVRAEKPVGIDDNGYWHPTARYRLLAGLAFFFDEQIFRNAIRQL